MKRLLPVLFILSCFISSAQDSIPQKRRFTFYGTWGYNREAYTKSTIHFHNNGNPAYHDPQHSAYDFTLYNCVAHDSPDFGSIASKWSDLVNISIPQFNFRVGMYFNNKRDEGFEISYDHAKYVVDDGEKIHVKGTIQGQQQDKDSIMRLPYFHFEHTDGANFIMFNYIKRFMLWKSKNKKNSFGIIVKPGLGVVYPRTDCTIFSNRLNNQWHVAGFIGGLETGFHAQLFKHLTIQFTGKLAYADYLWCYVQYKGNGNASHSFGTAMAILNVGYQLDAFFKKKK